MKHHLHSYIKGAYKSCQMQNELNIAKISYATMHNKNVNSTSTYKTGRSLNMHKDSDGADNSYYLQ